MSKEYDITLYGDGAGSTIDAPSGYAGIAIFKNGEIHKFSGYLSHCTVNMSELAPILSLLNYLEAKGIKPPLNILCYTDSQVTANCGNKLWARNFNLGLWSQLDFYNKLGYNVDFQWVKRNSLEEIKWCDQKSKEMRQKNK